MIERQRLRHECIHCSTCYQTVVESPYQIVLIDDATAGAVDDIGLRLHHIQFHIGYQISGAVVERAIDRYHIAVLQQFLQSDTRIGLAMAGSGCGVVCHFHSEGNGQFGHSRTYIAHPDDTHFLAFEFEKRVQHIREHSATGICTVMTDTVEIHAVPNEIEDVHETYLSNTLGRICRYVLHRYTL